MPKPTAIYFITTVGAIMLWSTSFVGTKLAYASFPPITLGAMRFLLAAVLLGGIHILNGGVGKYSQKDDVKYIALSGFLGITLYFTMENIGVGLTSASNAALIVASYPAITALLEWLLYRTPVSRLQAAGIIIAMGGVYILTDMQEQVSGTHAFWGNIILFATGFIWAFYNFTTRRMVNKYSATTFAFYQTLAGAILFLPLTLFELADWQMPTTDSIIVLFYLAVFCSVAAFMMYNFGLRRLTSGVAVSLMNLVPIFGVTCSVIVLKEQISMQQIFGGVIVVIGVVMSLRKSHIP